MANQAKRCPLCDGEPQYKHYTIPEEDEELTVWFKRLECRDCGATVPHLVMTLNDAIDYWNEGKVLAFKANERVSNVEPKDSDPNESTQAKPEAEGGSTNAHS